MTFNIQKRNILQVSKNHANKCLDNMDFNFRIIKEERHVKTLYINNLINSFIKKKIKIKHDKTITIHKKNIILNNNTDVQKATSRY